MLSLHRPELEFFITKLNIWYASKLRIPPSLPRHSPIFVLYFQKGMGRVGNAKRRRGGEGRGMKTELEEIREMVMDTFFKNTP